MAFTNSKDRRVSSSNSSNNLGGGIVGDDYGENIDENVFYAERHDDSPRITEYLEKIGKAYAAREWFSIKVCPPHSFWIITLMLWGRDGSDEALDALRGAGISGCRFKDWPSASPLIGPDHFQVPARVCEMIGAEPQSVVGWLTCTQGPVIGEKFRLHTGSNNVGSKYGDIRIPRDWHIAEQNHISICCTPETGDFSVTPVSAKSLVYLNGDPLLGPASLKDGDVIALGDTVLRFSGLSDPAHSPEDNRVRVSRSSKIYLLEEFEPERDPIVFLYGCPNALGLCSSALTKKTSVIDY